MGSIWFVSLHGGAEVPYDDVSEWTNKPIVRHESLFAFTSKEEACRFAEERTHIEGGLDHSSGDYFSVQDRNSGAVKSANVSEVPLDPEKDGEGVWRW